MREVRIRQRAGFTIIELLVVIAIIGVLVAIIVPAVQMARESARKTTCKNNLKELGIALYSYHNDHGMFPINGRRDPGADPNKHKGSYFVMLLPYMDAGTFYDKIDFESTTLDVNDQIDPTSSTQLREIRIPILWCPTSIADSLTNDQSANYSMCAGSGDQGDLPWPDDDANCTRTDANLPTSTVLGVNDTYGNFWNTGPDKHAQNGDPSRLSGVIAGRYWAARFRDVLDGKGNTILLGEIEPHCTAKKWKPITDPDFGYGVWTNIPINWPLNCRGDDPNLPGPCNVVVNGPFQADGMKSAHADGAHATMVSGNVRFISQQIDYRLYQKLGDRRDQQPMDDF